jgi:voltage-gated sodium channel
MKRFFLNERNILIAVILNAIVIVALYFPAYRNDWWLEQVDHFFILLFLVEAIVKIAVYKPKGYFANGWNRFDFVIVIGSLPTLLMTFIDIPDTSLIVILRLFRTVRLVRFIRFVPNLNHVILGLGRALKASVFIFVALVLMNLILAVITCHFYADIAPELFGDPLVSAYSIFQLFTLEGWNDIPARIAANMPPDSAPVLIGLTRFYFIVIVLVGGILGMSLANAVFVDEMTMDNNRALEDKIDNLEVEIRSLKELLLAQRNGNDEESGRPDAEVDSNTRRP